MFFLIKYYNFKHTVWINYAYKENMQVHSIFVFCICIIFFFPKEKKKVLVLSCDFFFLCNILNKYFFLMKCSFFFFYYYVFWYLCIAHLPEMLGYIWTNLIIFNERTAIEAPRYKKFCKQCLWQWCSNSKIMGNAQSFSNKLKN